MDTSSPSKPKISLTSKYQLNDGNMMPMFGLGTWRSQGDQAYLACKTALKNGYIHIDTAHIYGNHSQVARALKEYFENGGKRQDIFITSKVFCIDFGYDSTIAAVKRINEELGLNCTDLIILHFPAKNYQDPKNPNNKNDRIQSFKGLEYCQKQGWTKSIGVSNFMIPHLKDILDNCDVVPAVNQIEIHPYCTRKAIRDFCDKQNILVTGYSPLGQGKCLSDSTLNSIAKIHSKSAAQVCIRWMLQAGMVCIPKSVTPSRIVENSQVFDFQLTDEEMARIEKLDRNEKFCWIPDDFV